MIPTLTLNPSLDRTFHVDRLVRDSVIRVESSTVEAAGKGVNVSRALSANGHDSVAVLPIGGATGTHMIELLDQNGPPYEAVTIGAAVRSNLTVVEADGTVTKLNEGGAIIPPDQLEALIGAFLAKAPDGGWGVACGSLPPGVPAGTYAEIARRARDRGINLAIDTSGPALAKATEAAPALVKPNVEELQQIVSEAITTLGDVVEAGRTLNRSGVDQALISLGADGVVLVSEVVVLFGQVEVPNVINTVGAGDTLLAGYMTSPTNPRAGLTTALAWARAAIRSRQTTMEGVSKEDFDAVTVTDSFDAHRELAGTA